MKNPTPGKRFELRGHTSDIAVTAYGNTRRKLFENAACAMFSLICDMSTIKPKRCVSVEVSAYDAEELLIVFLNDLLYYYSVKQVLFSRIVVVSMTTKHLRALAYGERLKRRAVAHDIKSVTYQDVNIKKTDFGYETNIIFDV